MAVHPQLAVDRRRLVALCRRHGVAKLSLFGSVLRADFGADSDVDVLVEFGPGTRVSYFTLGGLQQDLSDLFGRRVDVKTPTTSMEPTERPPVMIVGGRISIGERDATRLSGAS